MYYNINSLYSTGSCIIISPKLNDISNFFI
uniref:Uncharacterized protein n=1 Tax=Rhizophora mucronata TaxID=61149 RepID=A0A2P2PUF9_RHIMU